MITKKIEPTDLVLYFVFLLRTEIFCFFLSLCLETPGSPAITLSDIKVSSLTVKWTAPADDGGSPITAYRVIILKGDTEIDNVIITDPGTTSHTFGGLERDTDYLVKVFASNYVFEGPAAEKIIKTKDEGKKYQYIFLFPFTTDSVSL